MSKSFIYFKYLAVIILSFSFSLNAEAEERLVSLKPNITDILFDLGLGDQLVGVTSYCHPPASAQKLDRISDYVHVDVERVMALRPTLVLGSEENSSKKEINFLQQRGLKVALFPFRTLAETHDSILKIASLLGRTDQGRALLSEMDHSLKELGQNGHGLRALIVVGTHPLVVAGGNNILSDLLELLGAKNGARDSRLRYPVYSLEQLVAANVDVIVDLSMGTEGAQRDGSLYRRFPSITAVKNNRIYFLDMDHFPASPKIVVGARELAGVLSMSFPHTPLSFPR